MRTRGTAGVVLVILAACDSDATLKGAAAQPPQAAQEALEVLQDAVDERNYKALGFDSVAEPARAKLGQPLEVYVLRLDTLRKWNGEQRADDVVLETKSAEVVYPAVVDQQIKSTVSIFKDSVGYRPATFGNAEIARTVARYRRSDSDFLVQVPALGTYFIGRRVNNEVTLTPVRLYQRLPNFPPGVPVPSARLLEQLAILAKEPRAELPN